MEFQSLADFIDFSGKQTVAWRLIWSTNTRHTENMLCSENTAEIDAMSVILRSRIYFGFHANHIMNIASLSLDTKWILSEVMTQIKQLEKADMLLYIRICFNYLTNVDVRLETFHSCSSQVIHCHLLT